MDEAAAKRAACEAVLIALPDDLNFVTAPGRSVEIVIALAVEVGWAAARDERLDNGTLRYIDRTMTAAFDHSDNLKHNLGQG